MGRGRISGQYCLQTFQVACARRGFPASSVRSNRWRFRPIRSSQCEPQPIIFLPNVPRSANVTTRDPSRSSIHVRESIERRSDVQSPFEAVRWSSGAGTETVATHEAMLYQGRTISALRLQNVVNVLNGRKKTAIRRARKSRRPAHRCTVARFVQRARFDSSASTHW